MFVSWVGEQAGARSTIGWDAYTVTHAQWFKDNNRWGSEAKPGSVVFFDWGGSKNISAVDHVGLVKKDNGDGTITTIEGNTGNGKVEERIRPVSQVTGYGYPEYKAA
ncbi:CHAP domain-containing protein [Nonomuraea ferruginea]